MKRTIIDTLIAVYIFGVVATFGHASHNIRESNAPFAAILWPFYVSYMVFEPPKDSQ